MTQAISYELEDGFDFYKELYKQDEIEEDYSNICLISKQPLQNDRLKLWS